MSENQALDDYGAGCANEIGAVPYVAIRRAVNEHRSGKTAQLRLKRDWRNCAKKR